MTELTHLIIHCLALYYGLDVTALTQLAIGADVDASLYKVHTNDQTYFLKLKRAPFLDTGITVLEFLQKAGVQQLILPIKSKAGLPFQPMGDFTLILYPFVEGQDGFHRSLSEEQWIMLGQALRQLHEVDIPILLKTRIRREDFSPKWREAVRSLYNHPKAPSFDDELALKLWTFLQDNKTLILQLVDRSELLCQKASHHPLPFVLCHSDIHAGNVLINGQKRFYLVDWDDPILAPKERDLMFIGGGVGNVWNKPHEEKWFYQGYGPTEIDPILLAYYRYERIIEDIAIYSQQLLLKSGENRAVLYQQFMNLFEPNGVVDIAFATDKE